MRAALHGVERDRRGVAAAACLLHARHAQAFRPALQLLGQRCGAVGVRRRRGAPRAALARLPPRELGRRRGLPRRRSRRRGGQTVGPGSARARRPGLRPDGPAERIRTEAVLRAPHARRPPSRSVPAADASSSTRRPAPATRRRRGPLRGADALERVELRAPGAAHRQHRDIGAAPAAGSATRARTSALPADRSRHSRSPLHHLHHPHSHLASLRVLLVPLARLTALLSPSSSHPSCVAARSASRHSATGSAPKTPTGAASGGTRSTAACPSPPALRGPASARSRSAFPRASEIGAATGRRRRPPRRAPAASPPGRAPRRAVGLGRNPRPARARLETPCPGA